MAKISEVLEWVNDDPDKARQALEEEEKGEQRSTLIESLNNIIAKDEGSAETSQANEDENTENENTSATTAGDSDTESQSQDSEDESSEEEEYTDAEIALAAEGEPETQAALPQVDVRYVLKRNRHGNLRQVRQFRTRP